MRIVSSKNIEDAVRDMCIDGCINLDENLINTMQEYRDRESSDVAKNILGILIDNAKIAKETQTPLCQDTGMAVFFVKIGNEVLVEGDLIEDAINKGVKRGYTEGYLRKSVVSPISRINTKDNTPAIVHYEFVRGDRIEIEYAAKGFGSENMSR